MITSAIFWNNQKYDYVNSNTVYYDENIGNHYFFIVILQDRKTKNNFAFIQTHLKANYGCE